MPYTYPFDPDGVLASNLISNETHVVTAPTEPNKANFIVPSFGPFFGNSLVVEHVNGATITPLVAGVDYQLGAQWYEMRSSFSQMVYAAISFMNLSFSGNVRVTYQTVGGPYTDVDQSFLLNLAQSLYKLRNINWSQIVGPLVQFPVDPHNHTVEDVLADQVVQKLEDIADAIIAHPPTVGAVSDGVSIEGSGTAGSPFSVKRSTTAGNILQETPQGLYVPTPPAVTVVSDGISIEGSGTAGSPFSVKFSTDSGNLLTLRDNGLYYGIQAPANVSHLYVSTSLGSDTNPGTQALPLKTIAAALAKVGGDVSSTIHLRAGEIYPMDTKVFMSGTAVRNIVPYDDPYYDGAIHDAILADGAQHLQAYTQEIDRPILEFTWTVAPAPNNTQAFSTGGWVCKNASSVVFDAIHLRMSAYPPGYPGVLRASGSSNNTVFLGAGVFGFQGCKLEYGFASVDNTLGRFFRPNGNDVPTLSFIGTTLIDAGSRDFMTISTGSVRINVRDNQATVGGTTSQVVTPMPGNAGVAFTTRPIEGVVWGQDGMPTNVSTNLSISRDGHLPLATTTVPGAVQIATTAQLSDPSGVPDSDAVVSTVRQTEGLVGALITTLAGKRYVFNNTGDFIPNGGSYAQVISYQLPPGFSVVFFEFAVAYGEARLRVNRINSDTSRTVVKETTHSATTGFSGFWLVDLPNNDIEITFETNHISTSGSDAWKLLCFVHQ